MPTDDQKIQDILNIVVQQRDNAMNASARAQADIVELNRTIGKMRKKKAKSPVKSPVPLKEAIAQAVASGNSKSATKRVASKPKNQDDIEYSTPS